MTSRLGLVSIGIAGAAGPEVAAALAPGVERAGFHALWVNDTPEGDSLPVLAAAARVTDTLVLATGIVPVDRRPPTELIADVRRHDLPQDRLVLGIGAGPRRQGALDRVRGAVGALRDATSARIIVGAMGPRLQRIGAARADGVLLSWLTPSLTAEQAASAHQISADAHVPVYVRTALEEAAVPTLEAEAALYAGFSNYAAHFARQGIGVMDTVLNPARAADGAAAYRAAADELVLRAMTPGTSPSDYLRFVDLAADAVPPHQ